VYSLRCWSSPHIPREGSCFQLPLGNTPIRRVRAFYPAINVVPLWPFVQFVCINSRTKYFDRPSLFGPHRTHRSLKGSLRAPEYGDEGIEENVDPWYRRDAAFAKGQGADEGPSPVPTVAKGIIIDKHVGL
jgi:hypothetical protein